MSQKCDGYEHCTGGEDEAIENCPGKPHPYTRFQNEDTQVVNHCKINRLGSYWLISSAHVSLSLNVGW